MSDLSIFFLNESFVFRFFQHTIFHEAHFIIQSVPLLTLLSSYLGIVLNFAQERRYNILQNKSHFVQYHIFPFHQKLDVVVNLIYNFFWLQYLWRWTNLNLNGEEEGIISIAERKITDDVTFSDQATIIKTRMFSSSTKLSQDAGSSRHGIFFGSEQSITIVKVCMCRTLERWNYVKWLLVRLSRRLWRKI